MRFLWLLLVGALLATPGFGKTKTASVAARADQAYSAGDYAKATALYERAAKMPEDEAAPRQTLFYNSACCQALLKNTNAAFVALEHALNAGYGEAGWLRRDRDLEILRTSDAHRFDSLVRQAAVNAQHEKLARTPVAITALESYMGSTDISRLKWDDPNGADLTGLRTTYKLDSIVAGGTDEFDRMLRLLDWVSNRWEHSGSNECDTMNADWILRHAAAGEQFRCVEYAVVMANCLTALGYPARVVGLQREGVSYGSGKGHVVADVWSNQYQKWIVLDPQNDAYWRLDGIPLGAAECCDYFVRGQTEPLEFVGRKSDWNSENMKVEWLRYFYHISLNDNAEYFAENPKRPGPNHFLVLDGALPELYFQGSPQFYHWSSDVTAVFPPLNQVSLAVGHVNGSKPADTLMILLSHTMPYFDHYQISANDSAWETSSDDLIWALRPGMNQLNVAAVNSRGIAGKPASISLQNNLKNGNQHLNQKKK